MSEDANLVTFSLAKITFEYNKKSISNWFHLCSASEREISNRDMAMDDMEWCEFCICRCFFRVTGGEAASFGQVQGDNAPRIYETDLDECINHRTYNNFTLPIGEWSEWTFSGSGSGSPLWCRRYLTSGGEVRPRNMAIRIWKRTG